MAIHCYRAVGHVVESEQKFEASGLARTRFANNGGFGAGLHRETDAVNGWLLALIRKADIVELDFALCVLEFHRIGLLNNSRRLFKLQHVSILKMVCAVQTGLTRSSILSDSMRVFWSMV